MAYRLSPIADSGLNDNVIMILLEETSGNDVRR
jgi:hypothetical protein